MDNLTHSLIGALLGQAGLKRKTGLAMPALIIGANIPDIDATCTIYGIESLSMRRGLTHGPIAWVVLPLILAGLLWWYDRWQAKRGTRPEARLPVHFGWLWALSFIACLTHPAMDWLNNYGIRLLEPFSHRWFYGDTLFIVDIWLWLGMGFATWFSLRREKRGGEWRRPAWIALLGALAYIGLNWGISERARTETSALHSDGDHSPLVVVNPKPVTFWERETIRIDVRYGKTRKTFSPVYHVGNWTLGTGSSNERTFPPRACAWPDFETLRQSDPSLDAFLFWSRTPVLEIGANNSAILNDARFYNPLTRDRFSVAVNGVECRELPVQDASL
ncbi:MAG: metal-dependent hydrolase [Sphingomonadales bacterium 63-6]|nr:MAG: metal-dependent hydrolase [Sphingomonadales bacterium 63-6]